MYHKYPCLIFKRHHYYLRMAIPKHLWFLAKCKEICYTLGTSEQQIAVMRWKKEIFKVQSFLEVFEDICMKLCNNEIVLDSTDVDKVLLHRLEQIQLFLEENSEELMNGSKIYTDIQILDDSNKTIDSQKVQQTVTQLIIEYIESLIKKQKSNMTLRTVYKKLQENNAFFNISHKDERSYEWYKSLVKHLGGLEHYTQKSIQAISNDTSYNPSSPKIKSLLKTYDDKKSAERLNKPLTRTHWTKLFKKYVINKKNLKDVDKRTLDANQKSLELVFLLITKEYIEEITELDCRKLSEIIYRVPKRWHEPLKKGKSIHSILQNNPDKTLSKTTIKNHLFTFREFMRFAVHEQIIKNSFNEMVDLPVKLNKQHRAPFTSNELRVIFNPKNYPKPDIRNNMPKFWVPLIALYQGCRINEICQLDVNDIVKDRGIPCFSINEDAEDKSVKTEPSKRLIPVHPQLIKMGFLTFVLFQRQNKERKLFSTLKKQNRNGYADQVQRWFARYLDKLDITESNKVFHSFRHTFECKAIEKKLHTEHQNALGGWTNKGVGQAVYGRKLSTKVLFNELSKVNYPLSSEMKALEKEFKDSFIYRNLIINKN